MTFIDQLEAAWQQRDTLLCIGLDPTPDRFPEHLKAKKDSIYDFCRQIIDATAGMACAFKPQIAYFASQRAEDQLEAVIAYIHETYPGIPVILDSKRGDIGSTAEHYAREAFERYQADAVTVNPYMGKDSLDPYLAYPEKGVIVLCRTSNPGGSDLQFLQAGSEKLYEYVARRVSHDWNSNGQCALVVGATFPEEIRRVRTITGNMPLLVPGIGAQGGDIQATVQAGQTDQGTGLIINSSRAILYAGQGEDFALQARRVAQQTKESINLYRTRLV